MLSNPVSRGEMLPCDTHMRAMALSVSEQPWGKKISSSKYLVVLGPPWTTIVDLPITKLELFNGHWLDVNLPGVY